MSTPDTRLPRRAFLKLSAAAAAGITLFPSEAQAAVTDSLSSKDTAPDHRFLILHFLDPKDPLYSRPYLQLVQFVDKAKRVETVTDNPPYKLTEHHYWSYAAAGTANLENRVVIAALQIEPMGAPFKSRQLELYIFDPQNPRKPDTAKIPFITVPDGQFMLDGTPLVHNGVLYVFVNTAQYKDLKTSAFTECYRYNGEQFERVYHFAPPDGAGDFSTERTRSAVLGPDGSIIAAIDGQTNTGAGNKRVEDYVFRHRLRRIRQDGSIEAETQIDPSLTLFDPQIALGGDGKLLATFLSNNEGHFQPCLRWFPSNLQGQPLSPTSHLNITYDRSPVHIVKILPVYNPQKGIYELAVCGQILDTGRFIVFPLAISPEGEIPGQIDIANRPHTGIKEDNQYPGIATDTSTGVTRLVFTKTDPSGQQRTGIADTSAWKPTFVPTELIGDLVSPLAPPTANAVVVGYGLDKRYGNTQVFAWNHLNWQTRAEIIFLNH